MSTAENELKVYLEILSRRRWAIFAFTFVCVMVVGVYSILQPNIYRASATILVDMESANILNMKDVVTLGADYWSYKEYLKTQVEILNGRPIAEEVFEKLGLEERLDEDTLPADADLSSFLRRQILNRFEFLRGKEKSSDDEKRSHYEAILSFQQNIKVMHQPDTRLIRVTFEHRDPYLASEVVNTLAELYVKKNLEKKTDASKQAGKWLENEIDSLKSLLKQKEEELQEFRAEHNLISADERREIINQALVDLSKKLTEAESRFAEYKKRYRLKHPKMQQVLALAASLDEKLVNKRKEAIDFEEKMIEYNELVREVNLTKKLLEEVLSREKEMQIASSIESNNVSVVENALPPEKPVKPRRKLNVLLALLMGIFGGALWAFFLEMMKEKVHTCEDFMKYHIPFLGYLPVIKQSLLKKSTYRDAYLLYNQKGQISEIFNNFRTSIMLNSEQEEGKRGKTILFTSFLSGEGKTLITCNLAVALARFDFKTLIVEADLRQARMQSVFNTDFDKGLSDHLLGDALLEDVIRPGPIPNLDLLLNVKAPDNPSELLGSKRFEKMLETIGERYDMIVVDSPPAFVVTDPILLASMIKKVVLVAKYNSTPRKLVPVIKNKFAPTRAKILGVIISHVKDGKSKTFEYDTYYDHKYY